MKLVSIAEREQFRKHKNAKTQSFDCNTLIFNNIRFCVFVKSCKNTLKKPQKGVFSGKNKPFEAQNPTFRGGILCFSVAILSCWPYLILTNKRYFRWAKANNLVQDDERALPHRSLLITHYSLLTAQRLIAELCCFLFLYIAIYKKDLLTQMPRDWFHWLLGILCFFVFL